MKETEQRVLGYLGLAVRAGRAVIGVPLCCETMKKHANGAKKTAMILLESADTSENTHKRIQDRTAYYAVPTIRLSIDGAALAMAVGKRDGIVAAVLVTEPNLAAAIVALYGIQ